MNEQLDPSIVRLAQSISKTETAGSSTPYTQGGASGEYGAYQYTAPTWASDSQKYLGQSVPLEKSTPAQQDEVAYKKIKDLGTQGYKPAQIASIWNSGKPDPTGNVGTNKEGIAYDTPAYVKKVEANYNALGTRQQNHSNENGYVTTPSPTETGTEIPSVSSDTPTPENLMQKVGDVAKGIGNFLFPAVGDIYHDIKGDNTKTALQQVGDVGSTLLSGATIIPGVGEGALAAKAGLMGIEGGANVASKVAPGLLNTIGKNAALGAGFGASGAIGSGQTDLGQIAKSTAIGGLAGGVIGGAGKLAGDALANKASATSESRLTNQTSRLKTLDKSFKANSTPNTNPIKTLEQNNLTKGLKVESGKVNADALTNAQNTGTIDNLIEEHSGQATQLVKSMSGGVTTKSMLNDVMEAIANNPEIRDIGGVSKAQAEAKRIFTDYENSFGDKLPYTVIDNIRAGMNKVYDPTERDVARTIGDTARSYLYNGDSTNTALKSAMQNEAELIKARNFVEKLHGTTVPGGQLGKYFADLMGAGVGGAAGSFFGPLGEAVGAGVGGMVTHKMGGMIQGSYFNPIGSKAAGLLKKTVGGSTGKILKGTTKAGLLRGASNI